MINKTKDYNNKWKKYINIAKRWQSRELKKKDKKQWGKKYILLYILNRKEVKWLMPGKDATQAHKILTKRWKAEGASRHARTRKQNHQRIFLIKKKEKKAKH